MEVTPRPGCRLMYLNCFGLSEKPFNVTPDPAFLYLGLQYEEVLSGIVDAIYDRKGLIGLVGEAGSGKTSLVNAVLEKLNSKTKTAFLFNFSTEISFHKMLMSALVDLGVAKPEERLSKIGAIQRLHSFAIQQLVSGGNVLLVVDEAQNLRPEVMEDLRLLSNLETRKHKLIQILLAGQLGLRRFLETPGLENVNERIGKWFHLGPMAKYELGYYIRHRLTVAGGQGAVRFDRRAVDAIYDGCGGIPRRVNTVCDRALLIACCRGESVIGKQTVMGALEDVGGGDWRPRVGRKWLSAMVAPVAVAMIVGFAVGNFSERDIGANFSQLLSTIEKVASFQGTAFVGATPKLKKTKIKDRDRIGAGNQTVNEGVDVPQKHDYAGLLLDEQASLVRLFRLFDDNGLQESLVEEDLYPGLFSLETSGELYRELERPFRIRLRYQGEDKPFYLLVTEVATDGVLALGLKGTIQKVPHDFVLSHWDGEISWVYPYESGNKQLSEGMTGRQVLTVQKMLRNAGYDVKTTGVFDIATKNAVSEFQEKLGLWADGVVGTRTKALLYQVVG